MAASAGPHLGVGCRWSEPAPRRSGRNGEANLAPALAALTGLWSRRNVSLDPSGRPLPLRFPLGDVVPCKHPHERGTTMTTTTTITGNLTRDPEIRYTRDGQAMTSLSVATNHRFTARGSDEWQETTSYIDVACWRDLAENVALSLTKGTRVIVTGRLEQRTWTTDDGEHRSHLELVADDLGASLRFATAEVARNARHAAPATES